MSDKTEKQRKRQIEEFVDTLASYGWKKSAKPKEKLLWSSFPIQRMFPEVSLDLYSSSAATLHLNLKGLDEVPENTVTANLHCNFNGKKTASYYIEYTNDPTILEPELENTTEISYTWLTKGMLLDKIIVPSKEGYYLCVNGIPVLYLSPEKEDPYVTKYRHITTLIFSTRKRRKTVTLHTGQDELFHENPYENISEKHFLDFLTNDEKLIQFGLGHPIQLKNGSWFAWYIESKLEEWDYQNHESIQWFFNKMTPANKLLISSYNETIPEHKIMEALTELDEEEQPDMGRGVHALAGDKLCSRTNMSEQLAYKLLTNNSFKKQHRHYVKLAKQPNINTEQLITILAEMKANITEQIRATIDFLGIVSALSYAKKVDYLNSIHCYELEIDLPEEVINAYIFAELTDLSVLDETPGSMVN